MTHEFGFGKPSLVYDVHNHRRQFPELEGEKLRFSLLGLSWSHGVTGNMTRELSGSWMWKSASPLGTLSCDLCPLSHTQNSPHRSVLLGSFLPRHPSQSGLTFLQTRLAPEPTALSQVFSRISTSNDPRVEFPLSLAINWGYSTH